MKVLGIMTGTSVDAIDVCLVDFRQEEGSTDLHARVIGHRELKWPGTLHDRVRALVTGPPSASFAEIIEVDSLIGAALGEAVTEFLKHAGTGADLIVSSGQTVYHHVQHGITRGSLTLADPARIHAATSIPVLSNVRAADIARQGTGAPLAPILDRLLASDKPAILVNIGGIANLTVLMPEADPLACDTGPGNGLIDLVAAERTDLPYDPDGRGAASGSVIPALLEECARDPYFALPMPKSTGREYFSMTWLQNIAKSAGVTIAACATNDVLATLTELSARTIADAVGNLNINAPLHVTGGGARNLQLMARLRTHLPHIDIRTGPIGGIDPDAKEAFLMALIGYLSIHGIPASLPSTTGARESALLGSLTPPITFANLPRVENPRRLTVEETP